MVSKNKRKFYTAKELAEKLRVNIIDYLPLYQSGEIKSV